MGRYVWHEVHENIDGIRVTTVEQEWREDETPKCARCSDYGEWIGESDDLETCPDCGGEIEIER